jgi:hypothetical protein
MDGWNGKRERGSTGHRNKREAEAFVRRKLSEHSVGLPSPNSDKAAVKELIEDILLCNQNDGNKSVADDKSVWRNHLQPFFGHLSSVQVSSELIDRYISHRKSQVPRSEKPP